MNDYLRGDHGTGLHVEGLSNVGRHGARGDSCCATASAFESEAQGKRNIVRAVESVAKRLGNTKAVCRKCYIHPAIFDAYLDGSMVRTMQQGARRVKVAALSGDEAAVLALLQRRARAGTPRPRGVLTRASALKSGCRRSCLRSGCAAPPPLSRPSSRRRVGLGRFDAEAARARCRRW